MFTSQERVLCALNHEEPDRVPVFFGTSGVTSMLTPAYEQLKSYLGIDKPTREISRIFQYARLDDEVMERFGSDGRPLLPGAAPSIHRREVSAAGFVDEWGIEWQRPAGGLYNEVAFNPLRELASEEVERYVWPDLADPGRFAGLREEALRIRDSGCAVVALPGVAAFEQTLLLRGMDAFLMDMAADRDFAEALLGTVARLMLSGMVGMLREAGDLIDVVVFADDLGSQDGLLISPAMYRALLKPLHAELIRTIKAHSPAKVFMHSDGNVFPVIEDLIEVGVDILNPVQVSAGDMGDTVRLKRRFGDRLSFCGAIDTRWALPRGTPEDVRREVRRRIADLGPGGGYILASVHCLQPDVPVENVLALFDEARVAGRYPLKT
ncbi:MAG: uroporphyrinogen decarboxylase family protein [Candidatus Limnocylindrales bacterium]|jgi:uroporphyrinogen decarboxylase